MADEQTTDDTTVVTDDAAGTTDDTTTTTTTTDDAATGSDDQGGDDDGAGGDEGPKTVAEAIEAGIELGGRPRKITPKAEEIANGDNRPRNADGTFKTETAEEKTARERLEKIAKETPEEKTAREAEEAKAAKVDHVNDEIPKDLNKRTAERMKYLVDTVKTQATLIESHDNLFSTIQDTGATPQEFGAMVAYMKAVHSNDIPMLENAYKIIQAELRGLAVKLGKPLPEVNLLRDPANADLVKDIQEGKISNPRAHELALAREKARVEQNTTTATRTTAQQLADDKKASDAGTAALNKLDGELRARDGDDVFTAKYDIIVPLLKKLFPRLDPKEWVAVFTDHYNEVQVPTKPAVTTTTVTPTVKPKPQPQRPKQPAGAGNAVAAPKSALEAITRAIEGA